MIELDMEIEAVHSKKFIKSSTIKFYPENTAESSKNYKMKFIEIVSIAFRTADVGISFIYKAFLNVRVSSLFKLLADEMTQQKKLTVVPKSADDKEKDKNHSDKVKLL